MADTTPRKQTQNRKGAWRRLLGALATLLAWLMPWRWPGLIRARREAALKADLAAMMDSAAGADHETATADTADIEDDIEDDASLWPPRRIALIERLWGEGQTLPGTNDFINTYLPLMALSEKKSIAVLGASMGGMNARLVDDTGVWIAGYEADPELAALGAERMVMKALSRKAPIKHDDMEDLELKPKSLDGIVSLESLFTVKNKEALFRTVADSLRVDGEFFYTDYVLDGAAAPTSEVADWFKSEPYPPHLWTADNTQAFLVSLGLDVRPPQDITPDYRREILKGWMQFLSNVTRAELLDMADEVFAECAFWAKRMAALDSGGLRVYKFNAFKMPGH